MSCFKSLKICMFLSALLLAGCTQVPNQGSSSLDESNNASSAANASSGKRNAFTGEYGLTDEIASHRPLAVAMNNIAFALPQNGISAADLVIESEVSAGITRLLAFYSDWKTMPKVGTVRELTPCLADLAQAYDGITLHIDSGSAESVKTLKGRGYSTLNAMNYSDGVLTYRDEALKALRATEHTMVSSGELISKVSQRIKLRMEYREDVPDTWFAFKDLLYTPSQYRARMIYLKYGMSAEYHYDEQKKAYKRFVNKAAQIDLNDNSQVEVTNVILIFAKHTASTNGSVIDLSSGDGYYFSNGGGQKIYWQRNREVTDTFMFYDLEGKEIQMNIGNSWINIIPSELASNVSWAEIG